MFEDKVAAVLECLEEFRGEHLASGCVVLGLHTATFGGGGEDGEEDAMTNENTDSTANPVAPPCTSSCNPMAAYFSENQASIDAANASSSAADVCGGCEIRTRGFWRKPGTPATPLLAQTAQFGCLCSFKHIQLSNERWVLCRSELLMRSVCLFRVIFSRLLWDLYVIC